MSKTTIKQKILLVLFGTLLTFVLLELVLRLGGVVFNLLLERENRITLESNEFRILCVGESTTAMGGRDSYSYQLEEILNQRKPDIKFEVINKGLVSTNSNFILAGLDENLDKYKPHLVISMLGINDYLVEKNRIVLQGENFLESLRVYQLFAMLKLHLKERIKDLKASPTSVDETAEILENLEDQDDIHIKKIMGELEASLRLLSSIERAYVRLKEQLDKTPPGMVRERIKQGIAQQSMRKAWALVRIAKYYRARKNYLEAEKYSKMSIMQNPNNYGAYVELGRVYKEREDYGSAVPMFKKAIEFEPDGILAPVELGRCYYALGLKEDVFNISKIIYEKEANQFRIYTEVAGWLKDFGYYELAEKMLFKGIEKDSRQPSFYEELSKIYELTGQKEKAKEFLEKGKDLRKSLEGFPLVTVHNYNKIADKVYARGIPLICMQYPRRDIRVLKDMFWSNHPIFFVENKTNFEEALKDEQYAEYFSDGFAGDFGHCTRKGNQLIAENLADTILSQIVFEQNKESSKNKN